MSKVLTTQILLCLRFCVDFFLLVRFIIGHITPEAQAGGPIALLRDDDPIVIDAENRTISVLLKQVTFLFF